MRWLVLCPRFLGTSLSRVSICCGLEKVTIQEFSTAPEVIALVSSKTKKVNPLESLFMHSRKLHGKHL